MDNEQGRSSVKKIKQGQTSTSRYRDTAWPVVYREEQHEDAARQASLSRTFGCHRPSRHAPTHPVIEMVASMKRCKQVTRDWSWTGDSKDVEDDQVNTCLVALVVDPKSGGAASYIGDVVRCDRTELQFFGLSCVWMRLSRSRALLVVNLSFLYVSSLENLIISAVHSIATNSARRSEDISVHACRCKQRHHGLSFGPPCTLDDASWTGTRFSDDLQLHWRSLPAAAVAGSKPHCAATTSKKRASSLLY